MLTVPPRLTPGADSDFTTCRGTLMRLGEGAHGIEMEVARNHAVLLTLELDVVNRGEEAAGQDALAQVAVVDRDGHRGLVVAVDHSGNSPGATLCPGGPLAALRTRGRLQFLDGRRH